MQKTAFLTVFFFILLAWIPEIYFNPQIYFYNPILVFFPGTIYDDLILLNFDIIAYRVFTVFCAGVIIAATGLCWSKTVRKYQIIALLLISILYASTFFVYPRVGLSTTRDMLEKTAKGKIGQTENQIFIFNDISKEEAKYISFLQRYYIDDLENSWGVRGKNLYNTFIFRDNTEKKLLFGTANADVAKPWQRSVFLTTESYSRNLQHELAHIAFADFSSNLLGIPANFDFSIIEGFATAATGYYDEYSLEYLTSLFFHYDSAFLSENSEGIDFFTLSSSAGYIVSGAFIKYLKEKYDLNSIKKLYETGEFQSAFNRNFRDIFGEFYLYIKSLNYSYSEERAIYFFKRPAVLRRYCPRYLAYRINKAALHFNNMEYTQAIAIYEDLLKKTNDSRVVLGKVRALLAQQKYSDTQEFIQLIKGEVSGTVEFYLRMLNIDLEYLNSGNSVVAEKYNNLLKMCPTEWFAEYLQTRIILLERDLLKNYLDVGIKRKSEILHRAFKSTGEPVLISAILSDGDSLTSELESYSPPKEGKQYHVNSHSVLNISGYLERKLKFSEAKTWLNFGIKNLKDGLTDKLQSSLVRIESIEQIMSKNAEP